MNKQVSLFILLIIFIGVSCKKDIEYGRNNAYITNPTSYILKREIWTGPTTNGGSFLFIYSPDHLISKIERYQWFGGPSQIGYDTSYYTFEYTNGLCTKWRVQEGGADGYFIYEYNKQKLPIKRTLYYRNNNVQSYSFYKYDNSNNLIEKIDSSDKVNFKYEFTYDSNNNLTSVTDNILWSTPQQKMKYDWLSFDNKVNFIKAVNGLPPTFVWDNNYSSYSSSSPNNFLSENYYTAVNIDQPFGYPNHINYSFEYNDEGLPTIMLYGPWIVNFEYEKYK